MLLRIFSITLICSTIGFNPFSDEDLYTINWVGPAENNMMDVSEKQEIVTVQTEEDEKYQCVLPESKESLDANRKDSYLGPTPEELMDSLFTQSSCSYRIESYWTYELCHGKHIKQYHENKELGLQSPRLQEFYLGRINKKKPETDQSVPPPPTETDSVESGEPEKEEEDTKKAPEQPKKAEQQEIRTVKLDGLELPYFSVNMTDGTVCDLNEKPRVSHIKYICQPNGRGEIYLLKETSSCEYDIVVLTAVLCSHPFFKPKDPPVAKINCHSVGGSPRRPKQLTTLESDTGLTLEPEEEEVKVTTPPQEQVKKPKPTVIPDRHTPIKPEQEQTPYRTHTNIGTETDKQLLRDFLNGDYCLHGGGGWWRHEFCYKKYAKQYHEEAGEMTTIFLGYWDKDKHLDWMQKNPLKRPKRTSSRKQLSYFYSGGDICDLTGQKRHVEVKLKCLNSPDQPHAVSIYLVEPKPCEYILGVESPIFCDVLDKADENGLFDHIQV